MVAFETAHDAAPAPVNNEMRVHTWGDEECCLPAGATEAYLYAVPRRRPRCDRCSRPATGSSSRRCSAPRTGLAADADPAHRLLVLIESVDDGVTDELYSRHAPRGRRAVARQCGPSRRCR